MHMQYYRVLRMLMTCEAIYMQFHPGAQTCRQVIKTQTETEPHVHAFEECSLLLKLPFGLAYEDSKVCHCVHHLQSGRLLISTVDWHYLPYEGRGCAISGPTAHV